MITETGNGHGTLPAVENRGVDAQGELDDRSAAGAQDKVDGRGAVDDQGAETGSASGPNLDAVRAQFEEWRCRPGRRHIPDDLWFAAIRLLDYYPVSVVSEHLRLNSARLQQQQHKFLSIPTPPPRLPSAHSTPPEFSTDSTTSRPSSDTKRKRKRAVRTDDNLTNSQPSMEFLQITPPNTRLALSNAQTACSIIIERGDGCRLTLRLPAELSIIESLCSSFLGQ